MRLVDINSTLHEATEFRIRFNEAIHISIRCPSGAFHDAQSLPGAQCIAAEVPAQFRAIAPWSCRGYIRMQKAVSFFCMLEMVVQPLRYGLPQYDAQSLPGAHRCRGARSFTTPRVCPAPIAEVPALFRAAVAQLLPHSLGRAVPRELEGRPPPLTLFSESYAVVA